MSEQRKAHKRFGWRGLGGRTNGSPRLRESG
jgi:hypothetical protein